MSDEVSTYELRGKLSGVFSNIIDNTLSIEGAGADAKATGDAIKETNADLETHVKDKNNPHGVTAEQAGARPNTWTPTASEVGARPNTWLPTSEEIGAAPVSAVTEVSAVSNALVFRKVGNVVYVSSSSMYTNVGIATIPANFRPTKDVVTPCMHTSPNYEYQYGYAVFSPDGSITIKNVSGQVLPDGWFNVCIAYCIGQG